MFLSNLNNFNSSPSPLDQGFVKRKSSSKVWKEKGYKWFSHFFFFSLSLSLSFGYALLVCFAFLFLSHSSFYALLCLTCFCLFVFSFALFCFSLKKKIQKQCVVVYIGTCAPWMAIETKFSKLCIFCSLDEHLYAQLNKWGLWLVFVMSKIK